MYADLENLCPPMISCIARVIVIRHTGLIVSFICESAHLVRAFLEAEDMAKAAEHQLSSAHVLLALFTFPNRAKQLLNEKDIDEERILDAFRTAEDEPAKTVQRLRARARDIATHSSADQVDCLHLLIAITRLRDCFAYRLLDQIMGPLTQLRNQAVSFVTGSMPRRYQSIPKSGLEQRAMLSPRSSNRRISSPGVVEAEPEAPAIRAVPEPAATPIPPAIQLQEEPNVARIAPEPASENESQENAEPERLPIEELAPTLATLGVDLSQKARDGDLDLVFGRDMELQSLIDILGKRRSNNPILIGPPGVGKTAIVEGLAVLIARGDESVQHFADKRLFALDTGALVAGTSLRGAFSERMQAIKKEVKDSNGGIVVFIDEIHTLMGAGSSGEGAQDAANELKTALARGDFPCIGATTHDEFKKHVEKDPALERRFTPISVEEPSTDEAILILEGGVAPYAEHHRVSYHLDAIHAAVHLTHRFVSERKLPDKAFAALDLAGSRARRRGRDVVDRLEVAKVVHEWTQVPLERLADLDADRFSHAEEVLSQSLVGHKSVIESVTKALKRGFAGFSTHRPIGSFLFLGPTGVGKTELVKVLADFLFGRKDAVIRLDMSEYTEKHSVARLVGAQPGYVGHDQGGLLTEALRKRPFQIVLFDEIEKGHPDVLNILLQVLDEGQLTDSKGRSVSFSNAVVILTSNLGADALKAAAAPKIGFGASNDDTFKTDASIVLERAREQMLPELWGRLDERQVFLPLSRSELLQVTELQLQSMRRILYQEKQIEIRWSPDVASFVLDKANPDEFGARGIRQTIQSEVEAKLADEILNAELAMGETALLTIESDALVISVEDADLTSSPNAPMSDDSHLSH